MVLKYLKIMKVSLNKEQGGRVIKWLNWGVKQAKGKWQANKLSKVISKRKKISKNWKCQSTKVIFYAFSLKFFFSISSE